MVDHSQEECEFWLPPEFLTDEDSHHSHPNNKNVSDSAEGTDSVPSSTESESDEDDYISNKMPIHNKGCRLSSSPKSPLCKGPGVFSTVKKVEEIPKKEEVVPMGQKGFTTSHPHLLSYQELLAIRHLQFQEVRRQQMMNQSRGENGERMPMGLPVSPWPQLQPQPQPMRPVFLGNNVADATKPRAGTGVFLPRPVPTTTENRKKKPACSPVVIPDKVVKALNSNVEKLYVHKQTHHRPGYNNNGLSAHHGTSSNCNSKIKKNNVMHRIAMEDPVNQAVSRLPPEWTY